MWPEMANSMNEVSFKNEAERIRYHLELVVGHIGQVDNYAKSSLLKALGDYAIREVFPQNYVLPFRNPVFIDPHGTACAVGHLMIESGYADLALRIDQQMELKYVEEMDWPEIASWANTFGFSIDELAWIQPGYPPNTVWTAPGGGLTGAVHAMTRTAADLLVVAGDFDLGGSPGLTQVATWDGTTYSLLGNGVFGPVHDLIEFNGQIHAAGAFYFLNAFYDIATWDGTFWIYGNAQLGMAPTNFDLQIHNGELYAAGLSSGFAGISHMVMKEQSGSWIIVGQAFDDTVQTLESFDGDLYAGGHFTATIGVPSVMAGHVAMLDNTGAWSEAFGGLNANVYDMAVSFNTLFAGGTIGDTTDASFGLAAAWPGSVSWSGYLDYASQQFLPFGGKREIRSLEMVGTQLFAGGSFELMPLLGTIGQNIMWVDQGSAYGVMQATMDGPVECMAEGLSTSLFIGGEFTTMNNLPVANIGWTDVSVMNVSEINDTGFNIWPNPSSGSIHISIRSEHIGEKIMIHDISGKIVLEERLNAVLFELMLDDLENGSYLISMAEQLTTQRFVLSR